MADNFFEIMNSLVSKEQTFNREELADFQPLIVNRFLYFSGYDRQAMFLNLYTYKLDKELFYLLAQKTLPKGRPPTWSYVKKPEKEVESFFVIDLAKYFRMSRKEAKEALEIFTEQQKQDLCKKFGYNNKQVKELGFETIQRVSRPLSKWW